MPALTARPVTRTNAQPRKTPKISRTHKPEKLELHEWQRALRRQFGQERAGEFEIHNLGKEKIFSEFAVRSPDSGRTYRVAIRGVEPGVNYCSCPDYAINTLGTCKHIEGVLFRIERRFAAELRNGFVPPFAEVYVRYGAQRRIVFSPGRDCPPALRGLAARFFGPAGKLDARGIAAFDEFVRGAAKIDHELRVYDDARALIAEDRDAAARRTRLQRRYGDDAAAVWRKLLKVPLFPYQRTGTLFAAQAGRALIADEMGLGKTIQAIAAAEILARDGGVERVLIVCPSTLKSQWLYEIGQFSARPALIIEGQTHQRKKLYEQGDVFFKIVNYDVVYRDLDAIAAWSTDLIILDEAQRIKNWQTRAAKAVKQIDSSYAVVLTGTPLENRIEELHSIVEFVDRFRLGPLFAFKAAHEVVEEGSSKVVGYRDLNKINKTLAPILIRRTKKEVLDQLPPRMDKNFFVPMTEPQWIPHRENQETVSRVVAKWRRYKFLTESDQLRLRIALQNMRMACDSTYLIDHETKHGAKVDELGRLLEEVFEDREAKVVIFSQWVRMNELVIEMLENRRWGHVHLHGGVPVRERKDLTRALREDEKCRVFLSTDAGGVGLNLQSASAVINMDLPWNPAVLEQRIARVHRLGQKRPVRVVNFVAEGTIEHGMLTLLSFKRSVFAGVLDGATDNVMMGDGALNRFMKTVETAASSVPVVAPTPLEQEASAPCDATGNAAAKREAVETSGALLRAATIDARLVGELFARGADFLQTIGRALQSPPPSGDAGERAAMPPLLATDSRTGRTELRIPLPDEQTLRNWTSQLAAVLSAFSIKT